MIRPIPFKQTILIIFMILLAVGCTPDSGTFSFNQGTPTPEATPTPLPTPVAVFQTTISADGQIVLPQEPQVFSFQSSGLSGTVKDIYVVPGQRVKTGDLLAEIDDTDLRNALARAEASLASLEAQIASESAPA
ncbi:MAG: biotin/lipoyl-binding protein, partial [Anaerolineae bacterium]|nr:biotin/lipoyl-binding protein [Anaerolineae bacterium]